jgi:hypothetical protein
VHRVHDSHSGNYALEEGGPDWPAFIMGIYLYQRVQIKAGFSYQGSYWARNPSINDPFARRLGVLWLNAGGNPIDSFRVLPGESSEYSFHEGGGYAPCGAKLAEVRFDKADWGYIRYDDAYFALVEADPPIVCPDNGRLIKDYVIDHLQIVSPGCERLRTALYRSGDRAPSRQPRAVVVGE